MKTEFLQGLGISEENIQKILGENGKDIKKYQDEIEALKNDKAQLENDKNVLTKEKEEKEKAYNDLQKNTISRDEYDKKIKEIEDTSKKAHEDYVLEQLLDQALESAKVLNTENSRKSVKGLLDMDKISIAKDQKSLIGVKEQLEAIKKTDGYFFEKTMKGYSPVANNVTDDDDDNSSSISSASDIAKELNAKENTGGQKSQFFN